MLVVAHLLPHLYKTGELMHWEGHGCACVHGITLQVSLDLFQNYLLKMVLLNSQNSAKAVMQASLVSPVPAKLGLRQHRMASNR